MGDMDIYVFFNTRTDNLLSPQLLLGFPWVLLYLLELFFVLF